MIQPFCLSSRFLVFAVLLACSSFPLGAAFTDVSSQMGISYIHSLKQDGVNNHGGAAVLDVNGDGAPDLIFARYQKHPLLYINDGSGAFVESAVASGLAQAIDASGFGAGDFDNDGDQDLYMTVHEGNRFYLYINNGSGQFAEQAVARGADLSVTELPHKGYSVGLVDYDLDGYLDIYLSEWGVARSSEQALHSALLRNRGMEDPGHFEVATESAGLVQPVSTDIQHGFSSAWADFDRDGWPDLALVADYGKSQMYWNDGDGSFTQTTSASGVGFDENGMGVAVADFNGDGLLDFYVTSIYDAFSNNKDGSHTGNKLYRNMGERNFQEISVTTGPSGGVSRVGWGWGAAFLEYDNDGFVDLVATNGMPIAEGADPNTTPYADAASDATALFLNNGDESFSRISQTAGITDQRYGKAVLVLDWDLDGDQDLVIVNSHSDPVFYESDAASESNDWIRFVLKGTVSNADAIGSFIEVEDDGVVRTGYLNPSNAYLGQREGVVHFGLGDAGSSVDKVTITWPTGLRQVLSDVGVNQLHEILEPDDLPTPPLFSRQPTGLGSYTFGDSLELEVEAIGTPQPVYVWLKDGETIEGESGPRLEIKRLAPFDEGVYRAKAVNAGGEALSLEVEVVLDIDLQAHSIARWWNELMLEAIRKDFPDPTKHSRNLYHVSSAMWDAFWAYEEEAWTRAAPMFHREDISPEDWGSDREAAQAEAISYAAYTVLKARYENSPGSERSLYGFRWLMQSLGLDPDDETVEGMEPKAVGNRIGKATLEANYDDGSNELEGYADTSGYRAVNEPLVLELPGTYMVDLNRWQPLAFDFAVSQNGIPLGTLVQSFLGVNWKQVEAFAMRKPTPETIAFDPGPPPQWGGATHDAFVDSAIEVIRYSSYLDPNDETLIDISPASRLNNPLGTNDGTGRSVNPITGEAYEANWVKRADYGRLLAEYWADGPASETPPGHWNTLHNEISEHPLFERRYMGKGEELPALEWDVRAYLALNGGLHDAAVAAWTLKAQYDYSRPISMIRALAEIGQSSDDSLPSYDPKGIVLVPGLVEAISEESSAEGERHEALSGHVGKIAIRSWAGEPADSHTQVGGVDWILAERWFPYQRGTFVSPAFAAYVSGHSTFSRTAAEIMTLLTGSPFFPGGLGSFHFDKGEYLEFEYGPSEDVELQWATYYDAADQAGVSRLYGGIHVRADDFIGRTLGARVGVEAFLRAHEQRNQGIASTGLIKEIRAVTQVTLGERTALAKFESEGLPLYWSRVDSLRDQSYQNEAGLYLRLSRDPIAEGFPANSVGFAGVGPLKSARFEASLQGDERLEVEIEVDAAEPEIVLVSGRGPSLGAGLLDTRLSVYRIDTAGLATMIGSNDDWHVSDVASQAEALLLREGALALDEKESALALSLESGVYRFVLESVQGSGEAVLEVFGQGWRPDVDVD